MAVFIISTVIRSAFRMVLPSFGLEFGVLSTINMYKLSLSGHGVEDGSFQ